VRRQRNRVEVVRQLGDDVQIADVPEVIDEAQARRDEARIQVRGPKVRVERGRGIPELFAQDLGLAIEGGGAPRRFEVQPGQARANLGRLGRHLQVIVRLQQQLQGGR